MRNPADISRYIWPDVSQGRQPQHAAPIDLSFTNGPEKEFITAFGNPTKLPIVGTPLRRTASGIGYTFPPGANYPTTASYFGGVNLIAHGVGAGNEPQFNFVEICCFVITSNTALQGILSEGSIPGDGAPAALLQNDAGLLRFYPGGSWVTLDAAAVPGKIYTFIRAYSDLSPFPQKLWINGRLVQTYNACLSGGVTKKTFVGCGYQANFNNGVILYYGVFQGAQSPIDDVFCQIVSKNPWQIFDTPATIYSAVAAAGWIDGNASWAGQASTAAAATFSATAGAAASFALPTDAAAAPGYGASGSASVAFALLQNTASPITVGASASAVASFALSSGSASYATWTASAGGSGYASFALATEVSSALAYVGTGGGNASFALLQNTASPITVGASASALASFALSSASASYATWAASAGGSGYASYALATVSSVDPTYFGSGSATAGFTIETANAIPATWTAGAYTGLLNAADITAIANAVWAHPSSLSVAVQLAETWARLGLDPSKPLVQGQTQISFGSIVMALSETSTTVTVTRA